MTLIQQIGFWGWIAFIAASIYVHKFRIDKRGIRPNYFRTNWSRSVWALGCFGLLTSNGWDSADFAYPVTLIPYIPHAVWMVSSFLFFFNPGLNIAREKPIDYRGAKSGWIDPILTKTMWWIITLTCGVVMVYTTIVLWR